MHIKRILEVMSEGEECVYYLYRYSDVMILISYRNGIHKKVIIGPDRTISDEVLRWENKTGHPINEMERMLYQNTRADDKFHYSIKVSNSEWIESIVND